MLALEGIVVKLISGLFKISMRACEQLITEPPALKFLPLTRKLSEPALNSSLFRDLIISMVITKGSFQRRHDGIKIELYFYSRRPCS